MSKVAQSIVAVLFLIVLLAAPQVALEHENKLVSNYSADGGVIGLPPSIGVLIDN